MKAQLAGKTCINIDRGRLTSLSLLLMIASHWTVMISLSLICFCGLFVFVFNYCKNVLLSPLWNKAHFSHYVLFALSLYLFIFSVSFLANFGLCGVCLDATFPLWALLKVMNYLCILRYNTTTEFFSVKCYIFDAYFELTWKMLQVGMHLLQNHPLLWCEECH